MKHEVIHDIAIGINQITLTASFKNSKIAILDISSYDMGDKQPTVTITPNDSGAQPLFKTVVSSNLIKIRSKQAWTGTCDCEITKTY